MATDYDAPRKNEEELREDSIEELKARRADKTSGSVDEDETDAAEGFELLARLAPRHIALIEPSFTEPERVLRAAGARVSRVMLDDPWTLTSARVPDDADLVIVGNPTNPTSVLHPREQILPGRVDVQRSGTHVGR